MTLSTETLARVVAGIALEALNEDQEAKRPAIRIGNFDEGEVVAIATAIAELSRDAGGVTIKVGTTRQVDGLLADWTLRPEETMTTWRNTAVGKLVLIDLDPQGDAQGLESTVARLDDQIVLPDDPDVAARRIEQLLSTAWTTCSNRDVPGRLQTDLIEVHASLRGSHPASLRRWVNFIATTCQSLVEVELLTPQAIDQAVGENLVQLGLFPDRLLYADERAVRTRLLRNARCADLRQPSGTAISEDDLLLRIDRVEFPLALLEAYSDSALEVELRAQMRHVVQGGRHAERAQIELELWLELFEHRTTQAGLGQQIASHLVAVHPDRLAEFLELEVESGLDHGEQEAAERLLRAEPPAQAAALIDLLAPALRRRVEKLAFPDAQLAADPLRALLHGIHVLHESEPSTYRLRLEGQEIPTWSCWLFAFIYGPTLLELTGDGREGASLEFAPELLDVQRPPLPDEEEEFDTRLWGPLRFVLETDDGAARRFRWDPVQQVGIVAFAALACTGQMHQHTILGTTLEGFCETFLDPRNWTTETAGGDRQPLSTLVEARRAFGAHLHGGLTCEAIDAFVEMWASLADDARSTLVPHNAPLDDLAAFVLFDTVATTDGRLAMLATHPLRLRWISRHLRHMRDKLDFALTTGLQLNPENTELFFDWLDRASPHRTPPFIVGPDETVAVALREFGWHEEYSVVRSEGQDERDWLAAIDDASIDEMVSVLVQYLDNYPHKRDGLAVLLLARDGEPRLPLRVAQRLRARVPDVRLELNVLAPSRRHHEIIRAFDAAFMDEQSAADRMLPDVQLILRSWDPESAPELDQFRQRIDVALAPALFGTRTTLNKLTRSTNAGIFSHYDPWLHLATHDRAEGNQNVTRVMLPQQYDPMLETWSTLCVRHDGHSAVAPEQEANTDYFTLTVRFDRHQELFTQLHSVAHWVVTLDAFIGRDQVDALNDRPDVILVRTGVGKNEAYTLLVSSNSGRHLVVRRLASKLTQDLSVATAQDAEAVAQRVYEVGRNVVPGAILRAVGLGRAASEIFGLVLSRFAVAQRFPTPQELPGLEVWLSFDEHYDWFGRAQRLRADIGRFIFRLDDQAETVHLDILVVESKFRQVFDLGVAEQQLDRTTDLCRFAFAGDVESKHDAHFWLLELASAIEQTSKVAVPSEDLPSRRHVGPPHPNIDSAIVQALRAGQISLGDVRGVAVGIAARALDPAPSVAERHGGHELVRLHRPEVLQTVADLLERHDPEHSRPDTAVDIAVTTPVQGDVPQVEREGTPVPSADAANRGGLGSAGLTARYERLLDTLAQHRVQVDVPATDKWVEGPGFYILRVIPRAGVTVDRVVQRVDEISLALRLEAGSRIRTSLDRGAVVFEVPKASDERYSILAADLWARAPVDLDRLVVPLGENVTGEIVSLEFSSPDSPHLLVAGTTGSGKSAALETLLRGLTRYPAGRVRLHLVDPKGTELLDFEDDPHTDGAIGMDAIDAIRLLEQSVSEMQRRYEVMRSVRARTLVEYNSIEGVELLPWRVIVLDEYADLTSDSDDKAQIEALLKRLTQKARAAGLHVIVATQRPSADVVSTTIRSNLPAQLALRVKTPVDSRIIMDEPGAETLAGQGDAFLRTARGATRIQVAWSG